MFPFRLVVLPFFKWSHIQKKLSPKSPGAIKASKQQLTINTEVIFAPTKRWFCDSSIETAIITTTITHTQRPGFFQPKPLSKKVIYFTSTSDPHHDISKQPRGCCEMSCWGKVGTLARVSLFSPIIIFDHKIDAVRVIAPGITHTEPREISITHNHANPHCPEAGSKHAKNMSVRLLAPPVIHSWVNRTHVKDARG